MNDLLMIWNEVVSMLDIKLNHVQLKNWIQPLKALSLDNNRLILDAGSAFIQSMVEKKYKNDIAECMSYICEMPIEIILINPSMDKYDDFISSFKNTGSLQKAESIALEESYYENKDNDNFQIQGGLNKDKEFDPKNENFSLEKESEEVIYEPDLDGRKISKKIEEKNKLLERQRKINGYLSLNPKYTMDSFVRGASNDFAYATAKAVIKQPGTIYNPLFIYGLSGLGKTHLMQAIAHEILISDPEKKVLYITSENFMNEMIAVIENGTNAEKEKFRQKYRSIDVLLIDDIQFIAGKKATMEEVFHTFNDLKEANKQIVLSSDKAPRDLKNLEDRLVTRFEGGMTVDIQQPDYETRLAILNHKMKGESLSLPQYVLEFIAINITANIRELEGALLKVLAYFRYKERESDDISVDEGLAMTRQALRLAESEERELTIEEIILRVTEFFRLQASDLTSKSRRSTVVLPRQIAMYLCRVLTNKSLVAIGRSFTRDHTTVMHAVDKIGELIKEDDDLRSDVDALKDQLTHK